MKPKLVYLEWQDAVCNARWFSKSEAKEWCEKSKWMICEVGWIVEETKKHIVFASNWKPGDEYACEQFGCLHQIPKTWIRKRKTIKI